MPVAKEVSECKWYVMRTNSAAANRIRDELEVQGYEYFQAQRQVVKVVKGQKKKVTEYFMKDFFFIHSTKESLVEFQRFAPSRINFYFNICEHKHNDCVVIPDKQMEDFIRVAQSYDANPTVITLEEANLRKGDRIRIVGGNLDGVEGRFVQLTRGQKRKLIVVLDGIMAITAQVDAEMVEKIE
ncbi:MAG: UpxY family transcription antiterminator [Marinilabiliaceae bacterium]|nr:UpxY family transcription antiterminator [Marinilabiliaceae bacterium]